MDSSIQTVLSLAVLRLLRPLVRILLRNGMAFHAFAELAKKVYVDVAFDEFAPEGKKQTVSSVSVMTGLTRKEVKRLAEMEPAGSLEAGQRYNRAVRVISGWLNDPLFHDTAGRPADLPVDEGEASFALLVKKYSGDIPTQAMLRALERAGSITRLDETVRLVRHAYVPAEDPADKIHILGTDVAELTDTIAHNLAVPADERRFQRKVSYDGVTPEDARHCEAMTNERAQALLEELDRWLAAHQGSAAAHPEDRPLKTVSVGIYYYEKESPEEDAQ